VKATTTATTTPWSESASELYTTERPPHVGEVIANYCGERVPRGQRDGSLRPHSRLSRRTPFAI
jgi:hypothetical protein